MRTRLIVFLVAFLLIIAGGMVLLAWNSRPQVIDVSPKAGAVNVSTTSTISMVFSQGMNHASIEERLVIEPAIKGMYLWEENVLTFTPDQAWPGGSEIHVKLMAGGRAASWLTFTVGEQNWSFTTGERTLAYLWPSDGPADIFSLDPETGEIHQYTHEMYVLDYIVSEDGEDFYFSASNSEDGADIYRINRLEAEKFSDSPYRPEKLLDCGVAQCRNLAISLDGQYLAYEYLVPSVKVGLSPAQVWLLELSNLHATPIGKPNHETIQPGWSSTGLLAFYDHSVFAYEVVNLRGEQVAQIKNQTGQAGAWSTVGDYYLAPEIFYSKQPGNYETGISRLMRYAVPETTSVNLSGDFTVEDTGATYSPDGIQIAFTRKFLDAADWTPGRQIWLMNADGTDAHSLTDAADFNHYDLVWSRDGSMLAYVRFNQVKLSDKPELWLVNSDGSNPVQLVIGGYSPTWMP